MLKKKNNNPEYIRVIKKNVKKHVQVQKTRLTSGLRWSFIGIILFFIIITGGKFYADSQL